MIRQRTFLHKLLSILIQQRVESLHPSLILAASSPFPPTTPTTTNNRMKTIISLLVLIIALLATTLYNNTAITDLAFRTLSRHISRFTNNTTTTNTNILGNTFTTHNMTTPRAIQKTFLAIEQSEGAGARVRRSIGTPKLKNFTPFLMLDHFNVPYGAGFPDHPHRGQETITYLIEGAVDHEDFAGNKGTIGPGDLQFMTAGRKYPRIPPDNLNRH